MPTENQVMNVETNLPDYIKKDTQRGIEDAGVEDIEIPRLMLVQGLSSCRNKKETDYIEDILEGEMFNNVTRENYGDDVFIAPIKYIKEFLAWRDQKLGGGFAGAYSTREECVDSINLQERPGEWELVPTNQFYCLLIQAPGMENESYEQIVLSLAKSKNKVSKRWNALIGRQKGDSFSFYYRLEGVDEQNSNGQSYSNFKVSNPISVVSERIYEEAEKLYEQIIKGSVQINRDNDTVSEEEIDF